MMENIFIKASPIIKKQIFPICSALGLGDFYGFNLMILVILETEWSFLTRLLVVLGCIISLQVGYCGTAYISELLPTNTSDSIPGEPFPVVTFSIYVIILGVILQEKTIDCIYS